MRILSLILLTIFIGTSCSSQKKTDMTATQIEYSAVSRGIFKKITVENKTVSIINGRNVQAVEKQIDDAKWKQIVTEFSKIKLETIPTLKAPTEKRFYDGAAIGNLTIIKNQKTYQTKGFDNGFPPKEIEKLVNLLLDFTKE
jgi:major membrane immunogen (membrane-anchored lipoprotein)